MVVIEELQKLQEEIRDLRLMLHHKEQLLYELKQNIKNICPYTTQLSTEEVCRYSRQMILPQMGLKSQIDLKKSSVLIVGIGGLGCPAALYLAAAGVGTITLVDCDDVDISNLHRQILHSEHTIGTPKVESAYQMLQSVNSNIKIIQRKMAADSESLQILFNNNKYDVVLDGSDNVYTRYLLNDICVFNKVPLISGSALQLEGQLTVYNYKDGPCYRCLFPTPPPVEAVTNCGDGGVLGVVPGTIGILQALEAIKILTKLDDVLAGRLLLFDASSTIFMNVKLRGKNINCAVCGEDKKTDAVINYEEFCGSKNHDKVIDISILSIADNINIREFAMLDKSAIILDVRPKIEYDMCKLPNTINLPYDFIMTEKNSEDVIRIMESYRSETSKIYFICRRGNDSQRVVRYLKRLMMDRSLKFVNIQGGLHSYSKLIDSAFPIY